MNALVLGSAEANVDAVLIFQELIERRRVSGEHIYRVLFTCDTRVDAVIEVLQDFRKPKKRMSMESLREIGEVGQDASTTDDIPIEAAPRSGMIPTSYLEKLRIGKIDVNNRDLVEVDNVATLRYLRHRLTATRFGIQDITCAEIVGPIRDLTRAVSRGLFDHETRAAGIKHLSAQGGPAVNCAFFETTDDNGPRSTLTARDGQMLSFDDTDLNIALNVLDLRRDIDVEINQIIE